MTDLTPELLAELRRDAESWLMIGGERVLPLLNALDAVCAERDALAEARDNARAEIASLTDRLDRMTEARDEARAVTERLAAAVVRVRRECVAGKGYEGWYALAKPILAILDDTPEPPRSTPQDAQNRP